MVIAAFSMTALAPYSVEFTRAASGAAQLFALIDRQSAIDPFDESGERPSQVVGHIELNNVDFAYPSRPGIKVLDDFSISVPAGKVTALVVSLHPSIHSASLKTKADLSKGTKRLRQEYRCRPRQTMVQRWLWKR